MPGDTDLDALNARGLAGMLTRIADELEAPSTGADPSELRATVRRLVEAVGGLHHDNRGRRDNLHRWRILENCRKAADAFAGGIFVASDGSVAPQPVTVPKGELLTRAVHAAIAFTAPDLPDLADRMRAQRDAVEAYVRALLENTGGRGNLAPDFADDAGARLLDALGIGGVEVSSVAKSVQRGRLKPDR